MGMLFLADAVIHGGQFNSFNFIADFGCSTENLNWLSSAKSSKKLKVFHFNVEYETFLSLCKLNS